MRAVTQSCSLAQSVTIIYVNIFLKGVQSTHLPFTPKYIKKTSEVQVGGTPWWLRALAILL